MLFLEPELLFVFGGFAPLLVEDLRRPALLGIWLLQRLLLVPSPVPGIAPRPGVPHLQVLPGYVHPDEVALGLIIEEAPVDSFRRLLRRLDILEAPQRQKLALVRLGEIGRASCRERV